MSNGFHRNSEKADRISPLLSFFDEKHFRRSYHFGMEIGSDALFPQESSNKTFDISCFRKALVVGENATSIVQQIFQCAEPEIFTCEIYEHDGMIGRLGHNKYLLVDSSNGKMFDGTIDRIPINSDKILLMRTDFAEFALSGIITERILNELTSLNSNSFELDSFIPCKMGHSDVILAHKEVPFPHLRVICEPADAYYLFSTILEISNGMGGALAGANTFIKLVSET